MDEERRGHTTPSERGLQAEPDHAHELVQVQAELEASEELTVPPAQPDTGELEQLRQELEEQRRRAEDYLDQARRARAELVNYKRRVQQEVDELRAHAHAQLIVKLLPVLDDFHLAIATIPEEERQNPWIQGLLLIERKLWSVLEAEGVRPIEAIGLPFSPAEHEAIALESGEGEEQVVVEEVRRGYTLGGRVLRPSLVRVGRRPRQAQRPTAERQQE
jgi:molecular chaperone GrpE